MYAPIFTRYAGPTFDAGTHIVITSNRGLPSRTHPWDHSLSDDDNYKAAAQTSMPL